MQLRPHQEQAVKAMLRNTKGQIIVPTGGGKTMCMIDDAMNEFSRSYMGQTIVVVAPRILLANQLSAEFLEFIDNAEVLHVHSGETHHYSTTKASNISVWSTKNAASNQIIFTTYHSLHRVQESGIHVDTIYFDESHNAVQKNFIEAVEYFSIYAERSYFFTATPKHSLTPMKVGMNDTDIFGNVICQVPAPKLVKQGYILPPKVEVYKTRILEKDELVADRDNEQMIDAIDNLDKDKVLICAKSTKQIVALVSQTDFVKQLAVRGYSYMFITSKTGAVIDGEKVDRETFFDTLNKWGRNDKKFVVLHHSIL